MRPVPTRDPLCCPTDFLQAACGEERVVPLRAVPILSGARWFTSTRLAELSTQAEILAQVMDRKRCRAAQSRLGLPSSRPCPLLPWTPPSAPAAGCLLWPRKRWPVLQAPG